MTVLNFNSDTVKLGDFSRRIGALVVPSLGSDQILLDIAAMTEFGAALDWKNECLTLDSSTAAVLTTHRKVSTPTDGRSSSCRVAAIHRNAVEYSVVLR